MLKIKFEQGTAFTVEGKLAVLSQNKGLRIENS